LNIKVLEYALKIGIACNSDISKRNLFDRKNYFYPDLPKGYQITQDKHPICRGGFLEINLGDGKKKNVRIHKIHLEEDAGKSIHLENKEETFVDFNRAGVPLIELVTEPDLSSPEEAAVFLTEIRKLVRYLEICDGNMEEGSLRCDANVSIMPVDSSQLGQKVEIKNMNSIRNVMRAIQVEIDRQTRELEKGNSIKSETRTFRKNEGTTEGLRTKEELNDYRYFPDPDLSPVEITQSWLDKVKAAMPELPWETVQRFVEQYEIPEYDAGVLTDTREMAQFFESICKECSNFKSVSNWLMGPVRSVLKEKNLAITDFPLDPPKLAQLIDLVEVNQVSYTAASQQIFQILIKEPHKDPKKVAVDLNLIQDNDTGLIERFIAEVLAEFPDKVKEYKKGKKGLLGLFVGEVMKKSKGRANPKITNELLKKSLH